MAEMKRAYEDRHGPFKDRDECRRLMAMGETPETMQSRKNADIDIALLLQKDYFDDWAATFNTKMVISVRAMKRWRRNFFLQDVSAVESRDSAVVVVFVSVVVVFFAGRLFLRPRFHFARP